MSLTEFTPDPGQTNLWRRNYLNLQRQRFEAVISQLPSQSGAVLSVIPLLLHVNRSKLPGFVSHDTPSGILGLTPEAADLERLQQMAGQEIPSGAITRRQISGVFLINNPVAINAQDCSKLQIRVCAGAHMEEFQLRNLRQKCLRLSEWAASQKASLTISVHLTDDLFDPVPELGLTEISHDDFYCHSTLMAGVAPFWWVIPQEAEVSADDC